MGNSLIKILGVVVALCPPFQGIRAQQQQPKTPAESQDTEVVRISVRLVQVDGSVIDKKGNQVTDLKKDDFQLFVDGQSKPITTFYYVSPISTETAKEDKKSAIPIAPTTSRLREDQVRRIIVLVVANVSADALRDVKKSMNRFVDEQMQPGDLVSVIRPGEGAGVLQQFTSDKRLLHMAINGVRWNPLGGVGVSAIPDDSSTPESDDAAAAAATKREEGFYEDVLSSAWLRSLDLIVRGLQDLPGRKSVVLFSNGFQLFGKDLQNRRVRDAVRTITDRATRALVTFHTVDTRGLQTFSMGANVSNDELPPIGTSIKSAMDSHKLPVGGPGPKIIKFVREQDGLVLLAEETGGRFAGFDTNVANILGDQRGYYVLGYQPTEEEVKNNLGERPFHSIKVKMVRSNLQPHFKKGFYGRLDQVVDRSRTNSSQRLFAALSSPFDSSNLGVKLTSLYGHDKADGSFVRSLLHVDVRDLMFKQEADGRQATTLNIFAVAFDENGPIGEVVRQSHTIRIKPDRFSKVLSDGLTYELTTPATRSGFCQVRVIVQDVGTDQLGSASQMVEVPDISNGRLALTGVVVSGRDATSTEGDAGLSASVKGSEDTRPAVRRFRSGMEINYALLVLNQQLNASTHKPNLLSQVVIYRDGKVIYSGPERALETGRTSERPVVNGKINLGTLMVPGEYILQVTVTDLLASDKRFQRASRWMDFDVVE
jgi:VWFA-related protein